jgi:TAG lipase/lysophosphatidylethanolamine acyltransferase
MLNQIYNIYSSIKTKIVEWLIFKEKRDYYLSKLHQSTTYQNWKQYALKLDELQGNKKWKSEKESKLYDYQELESYTKLLSSKRKSHDIFGLMHALRACLHKNFCNINIPTLYAYSLIGTKSLIEEFIFEREQSLIYIFKVPEKDLSIVKKVEFFEEAKISYGQTSLMLSGGAIFGLYHIGVLVTLMENDLIPNIICGSSVGSILASINCCLNYDEIYAYMTRKHEEYDGPFHPVNYKKSFFNELYSIYLRGSVHSIEILKEYLREILGDITFKEAFHKTGKILNISVSSYSENSQNFLLNYITSPNVLVFTAAAASSAAPIMFDACELLCKNEYGQIIPYSGLKRKKFWDGSLTGDVPANRIRELFNINSFIVSQVNPWVFPFIDEEENTKNILKRKNLSFLSLIKGLIISEIVHRLKQIQSFLPSNISCFLNLFTQKFTGDITITPKFDFRDLFQFTTNPKEFDYHRYKIAGNKRVFNKISHIENLLKTEQLIGRINKSLKQKMNSVVLQMAKEYKNEVEDNKLNSTKRDSFKEEKIIRNTKLYKADNSMQFKPKFNDKSKNNNDQNEEKYKEDQNSNYSSDVKNGRIYGNYYNNRCLVKNSCKILRSSRELNESSFKNKEDIPEEIHSDFTDNNYENLKKFDMLSKLNNSDLNLKFLKK